MRAAACSPDERSEIREGSAKDQAVPHFAPLMRATNALSRLRCNFEWNALNLGVHRIAVDDELRDQRELTRRQLAGEIEGEGCIRRGYHLAREYCAAFAVGHEIATFGSRPLERVGRDRWQRPAHDVVAALMLLHEFDVPEQSDPFSVALDLGDESPARGGVSVI